MEKDKPDLDWSFVPMPLAQEDSTYNELAVPSLLLLRRAVSLLSRRSGTSGLPTEESPRGPLSSQGGGGEGTKRISGDVVVQVRGPSLWGNGAATLPGGHKQAGHKQAVLTGLHWCIDFHTPEAF